MSSKPPRSSYGRPSHLKPPVGSFLNLVNLAFNLLPVGSSVIGSPTVPDGLEGMVPGKGGGGDSACSASGSDQSNTRSYKGNVLIATLTYPWLILMSSYSD